MKVNLIKDGATSSLELAISRAYCIGYAGRDQQKVREHIAELAKIGVPAPPRTPTVYPVSRYLLTVNRVIEVQGEETSGEVEFVLLIKDNKIFVTVGSDHTDRELEKSNIEKSKQMCEKPLANVVWDYNDVKDHWDSLILRSWINDGKDRRIYQEGQVTALLPVPELLDVVRLETTGSQDGTVIFSGTVPTRGGMDFAAVWDLELEDPILQRTITHHYIVDVLRKGMKA